MAASATDSHDASSFARTLGLAIVIVAVTFAVFWPALSAGFLNWDDDLLLVENPDWRGLSPRNIAWMFTTTYMGPYQPLAWLSYAIDEQFSGLQPAAFHRTNLILHAATSVLFFLLARRLLRIPTRASGVALDVASACAALLFAVHPLRVESVAWITERRDVLCGVFFIGALHVYVRSAGSKSGDKLRRLVSPACTLLVLLAALSKGWAMTLPAIMLVLDFYPLRRRPAESWNRLLLEKSPILLIAVATAVIAYFGQRTGVWGPQQFADRSVSERIAQMGFALAWYPAKTFWPTNLLPIYELPAAIRLSDPRYALAAIAIALVTLGAWYSRRRWPALLAAWLAYLVTIAPFAGVVHAGNQIVADRYSYLSCLAFPLLVVGTLGLVGIRERTIQYLLIGVSLLTIALLGVQTHALAGAWKDSLTLWERAIALNPNSWVSQSNLANAYRKSGHLVEAREHFEAAVRINERAGIAWLNLGELLKAEGRLEQAEAALTQAVKHHPEPALAELQLGEVCARTGRADDALAHFLAAASNPRTAAWAEFGAGVLLRNSGRPADALQHLRRAADMNASIPGLLDELNAAEASARTQVYPASSAPYKQK